MTAILIFFGLHWALSIFAQTFFLHRYAAHGFFVMNRFWEKFFHLFTMLAQGPSYLNPRGYAILHRLHHGFSDTELDPHSPVHSANFFQMMLKTEEKIRRSLRQNPAPAGYDVGVPTWDFVDRLGQSWIFRIAFGSLYAFYYIAFVPEGQWGWYFLLPVHWLMGPVHGAIVNWGGHILRLQKLPEQRRQLAQYASHRCVDFWRAVSNNHHANPCLPTLHKSGSRLTLHTRSSAS